MAKSVSKEDIKDICDKYKEKYANLDTKHIGEYINGLNAIADEIAKEICYLYNKSPYGVVAMSFLKDAKQHYFADNPKVVILKPDDIEAVMHTYNSYLDKLFRAYPAPLVLEVMKDEVFSRKTKELGISELALLLGSNTIDTVMKICATMKEEDELL